jgi:hypothetical protein
MILAKIIDKSMIQSIPAEDVGKWGRQRYTELGLAKGNHLPWVIASFGELKMLAPHISSYELLRNCVR